MVLVVLECRDGRVSPASLEAISAARLIDPRVSLVIPGDPGCQSLAAAAALPVDEVVQLTHDALVSPTAEVLTAALESVVRTTAATHVIWAHTYGTRDYVPRLAARLGRQLVTDCVAIARTSDAVTFTRPMFQGRLLADVVVEGPAPHLVTVQIGAFRGGDAQAHHEAASAPVRQVPVEVPDRALRVRAEAPFRDATQEVDLAKARRIVAVGRGIKDEAQLAIVQRLATALGAELAASRPVCDSGWLPMDRQVGSSGQTVAPDLYLAIGISGAIQHVVGMKGSKTIVAINTDAAAPIFEIADYGAAADLFEVVPALTAALEAR